MSYVLEASYKHGAGVKLLRTDDDIDGFLAELLNAGPDYQSATIYAVDEAADEDSAHELVVGVDQATELGAVRYAGDEGEWFSKGEQVNPAGVRYLYYGRTTVAEPTPRFRWRRLHHGSIRSGP